MRENLIQRPRLAEDGRYHIPGDWYPHGIPANVKLADSVYIDTAYGFAGFCSTQPDALIMEEGSGLYEIVSFQVSESGKIKIGKFSIVNGATLVCNNSISIGDHCMIAWSAVITDSWLDPSTGSMDKRRDLLIQNARNPQRPCPFTSESKPVIIEENCWVGFGAVILPGVRLGRGCVIGCKTVITRDVPPYAVVAGSPAKIIKYLTADDTDEIKEQLLFDLRNG